MSPINLEVDSNQPHADTPPMTTYSITRQPRGIPAGTLPPEHVATVERADVEQLLAFHGATFGVEQLARSLHLLSIGENICRLSADFRYSIVRES